MAREVRIGTIGWNYPEWRGLVYDAKAKPADFLPQYATRFPIVEAASAHYGMPRTEVVATWAERTPPGFEVSVKVPDWIVRKGPTDPGIEGILRVFLEHMEPLRAAGKLGTLVVQMDPRYARDKKAEDLAAFVALLPEGPRWAVELRHASWWVEGTYELLRRAGVTLVWSALEKGFRTPPVATTDAVYLRLFGDRDLPEPYAQKRRDAGTELAYWADRIRELPPSVRRVDVLLSKYLEGYAPSSVESMRALLS